MKTLLSSLILYLSLFPSAAVTISQWTFESPSTPADSNNSATQAGVLSNVGNGTASGVHAGAGTDWSTPVGNGSAESWSANTWAVGDYFQFQVSLLGYHGIGVSWQQTRSATGPNTFDFAYSVDGSTFVTALNNYVVSANTWSSGTSNTTSGLSVDLTSALALNNASTVYLRIIADSSPTDPSGSSRIDNFLVTGTSTTVPDSSLGLWTFIGMVTLLALAPRFPRHNLTSHRLGVAENTLRNTRTPLARVRP